MSRLATHRLPVWAGLILLWLLIQGAASLAGPQPGRSLTAPKDTLARDSAQVDPFLPLTRRPAPGGLFISTLVNSGKELWAVGDSGFIACGPSDSLLRRVAQPGRAALHCAVWWDEALVCAGDSARVLRVAGGRVTQAQLPGQRAVRDLDFRGRLGLLGGDEGLLARSLDGGTTWDTLSAPLPMRFHAVLCQDSVWWAGGAGGRLYRSTNRGLDWSEAERGASAVVDLAELPDGSLLVLERSGALHVRGPGGRCELGTAPVGAARHLVPAPGGWAVGGEGGRLALLDVATGQWLAQRLPLPTVVSGMLPWKGGLLLSGAWNTLAQWQPGEAGPRLLQHALSVALPATDTEDVQLGAGEAPRADSVGSAEVALDGARYFQNVLDTDTRCTTPPTRLRQLERSLNHMRWLGAPGRVMLALDVDARGTLDSVQVLDEWPPELGLGKQARRLAEGLTFTPGFRKSGMVQSRLLFPVVLAGVPADHLSWVKGESEATLLLDSLLQRQPRPFSPLAPKALVKALGFPRKAKRFVWEGDVALEYGMDSLGALLEPRVLWESDERYDFGSHALRILPKLGMRLPDSLRAAPGDHLQVTQRLRFDRRQFRRAAKAMAEGLLFSEVLCAVSVADSARYEPGLAQLEWLLNDFQKAEAAGWPELELDVVLRHDGRPQSFSAQVRAETGGALDTEILRSLALLFTWGRPLSATQDGLDSLSLTWRPRAFTADSTNRPPSLTQLLHGVVY